MAVQLVVLGKTKEAHFLLSEQEYLKRIQPYVTLQYHVLPASKKQQNKELCLKQEEEVLLKHIKSSDYLILLDEAGKSYSSRSFASQLNNWLSHHQNLCFVIGGAFGFSPKSKRQSKCKAFIV